jgi:hypothetical protein
MLFPVCKFVPGVQLTAAASVGLIVLLAGCESKPKYSYQTAEQAMEEQIRQYPQYRNLHLVKFSGRVAVDGKPMRPNGTLFVMLNDPEHPDATAHGAPPKLYTVCNHAGIFHVEVPPGRYVVTFAALHAHGKVGHAGPDHYFQPDELKNLYNDPEKNAKEPQFNVTLEPPGKTDLYFDLAVAQKKAVTKPGPDAVTGKPNTGEHEERHPPAGRGAT